MSEVTIIGLDLAKTVFQAHGAAAVVSRFWWKFSSGAPSVARLVSRRVV